jgi:protein phosphatase
MARAYYNGLSGTTPAALRSAVEIANQKVHEEAEINPVYAGMGTTVSAMIILGPWAYIAQVGDSRVYLVRNGTGIHQVTNDHSLVAEQVRCGLITEDEARHHALKNLITRAVGIKDTVNVDLFGLRLEEGDTLLICSDGLSNVVPDSYLEQTLSLGNLKLAARRLVNKALEEGGPDNITALVVRVRNTPPEVDAENGAQMVDIQPKTLLTRIKKFFA